MPYTMRDAREQVLELLDDETGDRFARETGANTETYRKIDRKLRSAASSLLDDYVARGGDRFDEEVSLTTSADDGSVVMPGEHVAHIRNVRVDQGLCKYKIEEGDKSTGGRPDLTSRTLAATIVRLFEIPNPAADDDLLIGTVGGAARSWDAFDALVCARAADALGAKDKSTNGAVLREVALLERSVFGQKRTPSSKPWPERPMPAAVTSGRMRWLWYPQAQTLQLVFGA